MKYRPRKRKSSPSFFCKKTKRKRNPTPPAGVVNGPLPYPAQPVHSRRPTGSELGYHSHVARGEPGCVSPRTLSWISSYRMPQSATETIDNGNRRHRDTSAVIQTVAPFLCLPFSTVYFGKAQRFQAAKLIEVSLLIRAATCKHVSISDLDSGLRSVQGEI